MLHVTVSVTLSEGMELNAEYMCHILLSLGSSPNISIKLMALPLLPDAIKEIVNKLYSNVSLLVINNKLLLMMGKHR